MLSTGPDKDEDAGRKGGRREVYDLQERTARFGEAVIDLAKELKRDVVSLPPISQLVRAAGSIGANYAEADDAQMKKDFRHKIGLCLREAKETKHWLRMLAKADPDHKDNCRRLWAGGAGAHADFLYHCPQSKLSFPRM